MKAKLVVGEKRSEIVLEDDRVFQSKKSEDADEFFVRVANIVDEESGEPLEITSELTYEKLKRRSTKDLKSKTEENPSSLEMAIVKDILVERGVLDEEAITVSDPKGSISTEQAKENIGKKCTFVPWGATDPMEGTIKAVVTDKRVGTDQYRIECLDGKVRSKRTESDKITIHK